MRRRSSGVRGLIEAEAAKSGAIRRIHTIRPMHLGPQDVLATVRIDWSAAWKIDPVAGWTASNTDP